MGIIKQTKRSDYHGVRCAIDECRKRESVRTRAGDSLPDHLFTKKGEYICGKCRRKYEPQKMISAYPLQTS
jgi:hypothetical protein